MSIVYEYKLEHINIYINMNIFPPKVNLDKFFMRLHIN